MKNIAILGSTGSIGRNTLCVVDNLDHSFKVVGLAAGRNISLLARQIEKYGPELVAVEREADGEALRNLCNGMDFDMVFGQEGTEKVARNPANDIIISAISGIDGLKSTLAALKTGKKVAVANKESLVVAGFLIQKMADKYGTLIVPIDSEHSAIFQCLAKERLENVKKVILTASGGPFFRLTLEEMKKKSLKDALNHPRWKMGKKVTIDSATLMNKGLELIEARWLFGLRPEQLEVLIHPQSIIHSLVEMKDGSILAQLSQTDMRIPIQYALTYPERNESLLPSLDLSQIKALEFFGVNQEKFPLIRLAFRALKEDRDYSVALNAANEEAVQAFLKEEIDFLEISEVVSETLKQQKRKTIDSVEDIFCADREAREITRNLLNLNHSGERKGV